jgi:hypothetical protein
MTIYFSLNQALEMGIRAGARLPLALRPERFRVFTSAP